MNIQTVLNEIKCPSTCASRLIGRCQKLGLTVHGEDIDDKDAYRIINDYKTYLQFESYVGDVIRVRYGIPYVDKRISQEMRRIISKFHPKLLVPFMNTTFAFTSSTFYFHRSDIKLIDTYIRIYASTQKAYIDEDKCSLMSLGTAGEVNNAISMIVSGSIKMYCGKTPYIKRSDMDNAEIITVKAEKDFYLPKPAAKYAGIKEALLNQLVKNKKIVPVDKNGKMYFSKEDLQRVIWQRDNYIGIFDAVSDLITDRFQLNRYQCRNNYLEYLEKNAYFNIKRIAQNEILFETTGINVFYINKCDLKKITNSSAQYFFDYGLTEKEKILNLLDKCVLPETGKYLRTFLEEQIEGIEKYKPSLTEMITKILKTGKELHDCNDKTIASIHKSLTTKEAGVYLYKFANYLKNSRTTKYHYYRYDLGRDRKKEIVAYSYETVCRLAYCLFNEEYIFSHDLVKKALDNPTYAQMWLYLSIHYICGWRSSDIAKNWVYLHLIENPELFQEINRETIAEDILNGNYSNELYRTISNYVKTKIDVIGAYPSKTSKYHPEALTVNISPSLQPFFGRLILIMEANEIRTGSGYMQPNRVNMYRVRIQMKDFFGNEILEILDDNFSSLKMNKAFLQSIEHVARDMNYGSMVAYMVAAYARNHRGRSITTLYLNDHACDKETPERVLWCMFERGVMGVLPYKLLQTVYPDTFTKLSMDEQTLLIKNMGLSAYEMEIAIGDKLATMKLQEDIAQGECCDTKNVMLQMYRIGQGIGKGKDRGVYCLKQAMGEVCTNPKWDSCIANNCPYNVFTSQGIPALLNVIRQYNAKYMETRNEKYLAVLQKIIKPNYKDILQTLFSEMPENTQLLIRDMLTERKTK